MDTQPRATRQTRLIRGLAAAIPFVVWAAALIRMLPPKLVYEEPTEFWDRVPELNPISYLVTPWAGYLQVWARLAFLLAHPFGDIGPLITRVLAAGVIGILAAMVLRSEAIPPVGVRLLTALSLPFYPIPDPGPYLGPLNSQWWIAAAVVLIALSPARRWHFVAAFAAGLTGLAPCLALPVFKDRRGVALLASTAIQAVLLLWSARRPVGIAMSPDFLVIAAVLAGAIALSPLPVRTRASFAFLGLAIMTLGSIAVGGVGNSGRYLAVAWIGIALAFSSILVRLGRRVVGTSERAAPA